MALSTTKVFAQHINKVNLVESTYTHATAMTTQIDSIQQALEGNNISNEQAYCLGWRQNVSNLISGAAGFLRSSWFDLADVNDLEIGGSMALAYREGYDWMHANSVYFLTRAMTVTLGTLAGGKGVLKSWTTDYRNYPIENACPGEYTLKCVGDIGLGDIPGAPTFDVKTEYNGTDWIESVSNSRVAPSQINQKFCQKDSMLSNPSFEKLLDPGTSAATGTIGTVNSDMVDWSITAGTITNMKVHNTIYYDYDDASGADYDYGLALILVATTTGTTGIEQPITQQFSQAYPYYAGIAYYRAGTATKGTLGLTLGTISTTVDVSTVAASTWTILELPQDSTSWYQNFKPSSGYTKFKIAYTHASDGTTDLYLDNCNLFPPDIIGNQYIAWISQTARPVLDDTVAFTVAYGTTGRRQKWEAILNNTYYPSATAQSVAGCVTDS